MQLYIHGIFGKWLVQQEVDVHVPGDFAQPSQAREIPDTFCDCLGLREVPHIFCNESTLPTKMKEYETLANTNNRLQHISSNS